MLTHASWQAVPGLCHGFLDATECAGTEWEPVLARVGVRMRLALSRQAHGTRVLSAVSADRREEADALATATPGLLVGVVTADCMPVLLAAPGRRVVAAVHAGWRGTAAGVLEAAVDHLAQEFAVPSGELEAVIGPSVGGCCYEVGENVMAAFRARTADVTAPAWTRHGDRDHLDLRTAARCLLEAAGVGTVTLVGPCSACGRGYHSYRRDGARTGRQLSFAGWA